MAKRKQQSTFERLTSGKLNRKQRKELIRKIEGEDPGLEIIHRNAAGIDVGNESHMVSVPADRDSHPIREFGSWTKGLQELADWLKACGIESVVMQATGVYWIALYDLLEERGFRVCLTNARDTKNLPGRKTDVQEAQWLRKLYSYGLLRNSFRPPEDIRSVRSLWRLRDRHVKDLAEGVQHMQKVLTQMNVQLANTISDISGATGQAIIRAILRGERDPYQLAKWRDYRIRASQEEIARSLEGTWREDLLFELKQVVAQYDFCLTQMAECDQRLQALLAVLPDGPERKGNEEGPSHEPSRKAENQPRKKNQKPRKNQPGGFDLQEELKRICGVDLTRIDGVKLMTVQTFVSEVGTNVSAFATEGHLVSWLGLAPNRQVSGGKLIRHERRKNKNRVASFWRESLCRLGSLTTGQLDLGVKARPLQGGGVCEAEQLVGFHAPEEWGVWSATDPARLIFRKPVKGHLRAKFTGYGITDRLPHTLKITIGNESRLIALPVKPSTFDLDYHLPEAAAAVVFSGISPVSPRSIGLGTEDRAVGVGLVKMDCTLATP